MTNDIIQLILYSTVQRSWTCCKVKMTKNSETKYFYNTQQIFTNAELINTDTKICTKSKSVLAVGLSLHLFICILLYIIPVCL